MVDVKKIFFINSPLIVSDFSFFTESALLFFVLADFSELMPDVAAGAEGFAPGLPDIDAPQNGRPL